MHCVPASLPHHSQYHSASIPHPQTLPNPPPQNTPQHSVENNLWVKLIWGGHYLKLLR